MKVPWLILVSVICIGAVGCAKTAKAPPRTATPKRTLTMATQPVRRPATKPSMFAKKASLYERLGGTSRIAKVVDDFVAIAAADGRVNFARKGHPKEWPPTEENVAKLKMRLVDFISNTTGGPAEYAGGDMLTVHQGMEITEEEFAAAADDLRQAMDDNKIAEREQRELLAIVAATRSRIVQAAPPKQAPPVDAKP